MLQEKRREGVRRQVETWEVPQVQDACEIPKIILEFSDSGSYLCLILLPDLKISFLTQVS